MAGFQIHLIPDRSFFAQLAIFLVTLAGLTFFIYRPIVKIIRVRRAKTVDLLAEIKQLETEIKANSEKYQKRIEEAKDIALLEKESIRQVGLKEEAEIKEMARQEASELIEEARVKINAARVKAVSDLKRDIPALADEIINKIRPKK